MTPFQEYARDITRRHFFAQGSHAVGWAALATLLGRSGLAAPAGGNAASPSATTRRAPGQGVNYVGRIGSILPRFKAAGIRAYVDTARDAWIVGEGILRSTAATDGAGITVHTTRLRDPRSEMFVDAETTS